MTVRRIPVTVTVGGLKPARVGYLTLPDGEDGALQLAALLRQAADTVDHILRTEPSEPTREDAEA